MSYPVIEEAIRAEIQSKFGLDDGLVVSGDLDALFDTLQVNNAPTGVLLEYGYGRRLVDPPYNGKIWSWKLEGYLLVRYQGDNAQAELDVRSTLDILFALFEGNHTLGGVASIVRLEEIAQPQPVKVNGIPFYWVPFSIEALDKP